jgi:hypothetical protein
MKPRTLILGLALVGVLGLVLLTFSSPLLGQREGEIRITQVPQRGSGPDRVETIAGTVKGVNFGQHKVLLYARTNQWYVQPYADSPYTTIDEHGKWKADTHLGSEYAALLVKSSHSNAPGTASTLPPVGGDIVAIDRKPAK